MVEIKHNPLAQSTSRKFWIQDTCTYARTHTHTLHTQMHTHTQMHSHTHSHMHACTCTHTKPSVNPLPAKEFVLLMQFLPKGVLQTGYSQSQTVILYNFVGACVWKLKLIYFISPCWNSYFKSKTINHQSVQKTTTASLLRMHRVPAGCHMTSFWLMGTLQQGHDITRAGKG